MCCNKPVNAGVKEASRGLSSPGAGVSDSGELSSVNVGTKLRFYDRAVGFP